MNKKVLSFVNKMEGWKTAIKSLHWDAKNMSQHKLCDDIADRLADFQDQVSEVEQSISGKLPLNKLKGTNYNISSLKGFVEDMIKDTTSFLKSMESAGDKYIGMRSDCESFLSDMQRNLYLVNFTMKEDLKRRIADRLNEGYRSEENIKTTFHGTKPSTERGLLKRINDLTKNGQLNTRTFNGINDVLDFYRKILGNVGRLRCIDACEGNNYLVKFETESGWSYYGLLRVKDVNEGQCKASITFSPHGDEPDATDVEPQEGGMPIEDGNDYEEPFDRIGDTSRYDMEGARIAQERFKKEHPDWLTGGMAVENKAYEIYREGRVTRMTGNELNNLIKESVKRILTEGKIETWKPGEFVTWDDYAYYCNHNYDWVEKNWERSDRLGIPKDQRCDFCQKPLKGPYKTLYISNDNNDIGYYAHPDEKHNVPIKVGKTCAKAVEKAHKDKYGY